jgi:hypothetical protein
MQLDIDAGNVNNAVSWPSSPDTTVEFAQSKVRVSALLDVGSVILFPAGGQHQDPTARS